MTNLKDSSLLNYLSTSKVWKQGYKVFHESLGKPLGWIYHEDKKPVLWRLDRKNRCNLYTDVGDFQGTCPQFVRDYCSIALQHTSFHDIKIFRCYKNKRCALVEITRGSKRGYVVFCAIRGHEKTFREKAKCFIPFVNAEINSFHKACDLHNL